MKQLRLSLTFAAATALLLVAAPWAAAQQDPECYTVVTLQFDDQCVAPGQTFEAVDLGAAFDQQYPGHAAVSAWTFSSDSSGPPDLTIEAGIATITYPAEFIGCREVRFVAWRDVCGDDVAQAEGWVTFSVAPSPIILAIPPQQSDPQATNCNTILLELDAYLAGGVDPADIEWTAHGQQTLLVTIDPNTHVATVVNESDRCQGVTETITFRACLAEGEIRDPECSECPRYCWPCAEAATTFTLLCDADGDGVADHCDICPGYDDALDGDGDGVPDGCDACPGYDDSLDEDDDGVADGCDCCPDGDDTLDTDGDGVPDACDVCEGYDDSADADGDGIPDGCDQDGEPQPAPQPCPECPDSIETVAVGWFCPAAATMLLVALGAGVFVIGGHRRRL